MSGSSYLVTTVGQPGPRIAEWLVGVPQPTLQTWLTAAQAAYQQLLTGAQARTVMYGTANGGNRSVSYTAANKADLLGHIQQLQAALGNTRGRRAIGVRF